ncbi:hypothetical protein TrST_g11024 [Triparma strigata]|uniref:Uncharacterized protein n=1 Tax=Triparma strigata TaxID=1606541 RepID=A0A9W7DR80_9STRA|nr:hypothetical protein TrST_g11024 [Triparma strigata]
MPSLSLLLPSSSIRPFSSSISCLHKIGRTIFLESSSTHLTLRTLNDTKSSFMKISFTSSFFLTLNPPSSSKRKRTPSSDSFVCQIPSKNLYNILRHPRSNVVTLKIETQRKGVYVEDSDDEDEGEEECLVLSFKMEVRLNKKEEGE